MRCPNCGAPSTGVCRYCKAVSNAPVTVGPAGPQGPPGRPASADDNNAALGAGCLLLLGVIALLGWALISGWDTFWPAFWPAFWQGFGHAG